MFYIKHSRLDQFWSADAKAWRVKRKEATAYPSQSEATLARTQYGLNGPLFSVIEVTFEAWFEDLNRLFVNKGGDWGGYAVEMREHNPDRLTAAFTAGDEPQEVFDREIAEGAAP